MDAAERLPEYRQPGKSYDGLGRQVPRNPCRGTPGFVFLLRLPGLAAQFETRVPVEYLLGPWVLCACGELQVIALHRFVECLGGCGRWFLRTQESVRVAKWKRAGT